jgi:cyclopropane-fatty-acyl-phospholipid synthase
VYLIQAKRYPKCNFTAVSNSNTQKVYIDEQASAAGLKNVSVITADMNDFSTESSFDRVISVEMFEHMKNYQVGSQLIIMLFLLVSSRPAIQQA